MIAIAVKLEMSASRAQGYPIAVIGGKVSYESLTTMRSHRTLSHALSFNREIKSRDGKCWKGGFIKLRPGQMTLTLPLLELGGTVFMHETRMAGV